MVTAATMRQREPGRPDGRPTAAAASMRRQATRARGFTLIEMLAVIVLIGIAAAAVSMSLTHGLDSARIRSAGSGLASALRYTRTQAIVQGRERVFVLDTSARSYTAPDRPPVTLPRHMALSVTSAAEDQVAGHAARIRFFPDGSSTGGRVTLRSGRREWHVNVAWLTGAVSIVDTAQAQAAQ